MKESQLSTATKNDTVIAKDFSGIYTGGAHKSIAFLVAKFERTLMDDV